MVLKKRYFIIIIIISYFTGFSQNLSHFNENSQLKFEKLTSKDGLIHNSITAMYQDSKGYMWLGTYNGLYKYDGNHFKIYKAKQGKKSTLISNDILSITEDDKGILWIGTKSGLCQYNRALDKIALIDGLPSDFVLNKRTNCVYSDSYGVLWVCTNEGLYQLTPKENKYILKIHQSDSNSGTLSSNKIKTILEDKNKDLWVGTRNGLHKITYNRRGELIFKVFKPSKNPSSISSSNITTLCHDTNGNLWIGTTNGLNRLNVDDQDNGFQKYFSDNTDNSLTYNHITAITKDSNNTLWIGTRYGGVSRYFPKDGTFLNYKKNLQNEYAISTNEISSIYEGRYGVLWIGGIAGALNKVDLHKKRIAHFKYNIGNPTSLSDNYINVLYEDSSQQLWIGTINGGLNKMVYKNNSTQFVHYKHNTDITNSLSSNNIFSFCEDNSGNFWAGTENDGLNHIQISNEKNNHKINVRRFSKENSNLPSNNISVVYKDHLGSLWLSSFDGDGLMKFKPNSFGQELPEIKHYKHDPENSNSLSSNNVSCIFEDSNTTMWVGTYGGGLLRIERDSLNNPVKFTRILNEPGNINSLLSNNVFSIHEDETENLWIGTYGGGLHQLPKNEKSKSNPRLKKYGEEQGLTNDELYGLLEDKKGNLWISSNNGIYKFNIAEESFTNLQVNDGIQALNFRKFAYCKGKSGLMYFGGINGFNIFYPDGFTGNKNVPTIEITDFKIFNVPVLPGQDIQGSVVIEKAISESNQINLSSSHKAFSFEFSGLHYSSPEQNRYAYMLDGFDTDWNYTTSKRRYAAYSNLNSGTYTFKVKASNNDNLWNENPKKIEIIIAPALYNTWWAYCFYFFLTLLLIYSFRKYIVLNEDYQNKLKIEQLKQENIKKINKIKLEFFTNISHEFKTPLTLILGPLQNLMLSKELTPKVKKSLSMMERNANQLFRLINQVIEFRKIENNELKVELSNGDFVKFCHEVLNSFQFVAKEKQLTLIFESSKEAAHVCFDWDKLEKILNNLISNAIKNTLSRGEINLNLSFFKNPPNPNTTSQFVTLKVKDNGIGIPKDHINLILDRFHQIDNLNLSNSRNSGIGLALTKTLVDLNKGTLKLKSKENIGSEFIITFPLPTEEFTTTNKKYISQTNPSTQDSKPPDDSHSSHKENYNSQNLPLLLVVEDSSELQQFIKDSLEETYTIIQAYNGEEGLKLAISNVPDIIVSDVMMPLKNGIELCNEIKTNTITNHIPIIVLSAKSAIEHQIEGLKVGADSYMSKPFNTAHLKVRIQSLLEQRAILKNKFALGSDNNSFNTKELKPEEKFLQKINNIIKDHIDDPQFDVEMLGNELNFSKMQLYRKLKSFSNLTANELIRNYRINTAAKCIKESDMTISEIAYSVGFSSLSYFTKCFKKVYLISPSEYAKKP